MVLSSQLDQVLNIVKNHPPQNDGLFGGALGSFLFQWYFASVNKADLEPAFEQLSAIFERVNNNQSSLKGDSLSDGMAGFAATITHLHKHHALEIDLNELLGEIDQMLIACIKTNIKAGNVDFYYQALGGIAYLAQRLPHQKLEKELQEILSLLKKNGIHDQHGFRYLSSVGAGKETDYDLGLAHGLCGLCVTILPLVEFPNLKPLVVDIVEPTIDFLLYAYTSLQDQYDPAKKATWSIFPILLDSKKLTPKPTNRLAYCYGDLNPLLLLLLAQKYLPHLAQPHQSLIDQLRDRVCGLRTTAETGIDDAHFCHGSSGVAQFFQSLYRLTGEDQYREAYQYWIDQTYQFLQADLNKAQYAGKEAGLLEGLSGIGLVLLGHQSSEYLLWPELFLLP